MEPSLLSSMHSEAEAARPGFIRSIERALKQQFSTMCGGVRVSVVSQAVVTRPPEITEVQLSLSAAFPVLQNAKVWPMGDNLENELEVGWMIFFRRLMTENHGPVFAVVAGWRDEASESASISVISKGKEVSFFLFWV